LSTDDTTQFRVVLLLDVVDGAIEDLDEIKIETELSKHIETATGFRVLEITADEW